jgi:hypothetical protein
MAYTHGKREVPFLIATGERLVPLQTPAVKAVLHPGMQPWEVTGFFILVTTVGSGAVAVLEVNHRTAPAVTSGEVAIATITFSTAALAVGKMMYKRIDPVKVLPGQELALELITANTSGVALCGLEVNEVNENPANNTNMVASA